MTKEIVLTEEEKTNFETLVKCAEEYIEDNAKDILNAIRKNKQKKCFDLITKEYKPKCTVKELINKNKEEIETILLERFCVELQNYQAMPRAINYASQIEKTNDENIIDNKNAILETVKNFYNNNTKMAAAKELQTAFNVGQNKNMLPSYHLGLYKDFNNAKLFKENKKYLEWDYDKKKWYKKAKNLYYLQGDKPIKESYYYDEGKNIYKYNYAWDKYSRGLVDALIELKYGEKEIDKEKLKYIDLIISICKLSNAYIKNNTFDEEKYKELKKKISVFHENIYGINDTLTYDFFKELCCQNLIKDDIHIIECYKKIIGMKKEINTKTEKALKKFLNLCIDYATNDKKEYTPYYIDKILWLCCTGAFYEDGITIHKMTREDFFKTLPNEFNY